MSLLSPHWSAFSDCEHRGRKQTFCCVFLSWEQLERERNSVKWYVNVKCSAKCILPSFKMGIVDFLRPDQTNAMPSTDRVLSSSGHSSMWCMKNAPPFKDIPAYLIQTCVDTLFILSSAKPLKMNSVFLVKSVTVVSSRTSMSLWTLSWNWWLYV